MLTVNDLQTSIERRLLQLESALDEIKPGWRESRSDPEQLANLRAEVESCGRLSVVRSRGSYAKVTDLDWKLTVG
jgi:hypothetical protein